MQSNAPVVANLGSIAEIQTGPFGSQLHARDYKEVGTPIITVEHLGDNRVLHENLPLVGDHDRVRLKKYTLKTGDIVFSRVGAIDRRAYVTEREDGWLFSGRCLRVRPDNRAVQSRYLSFVLGTPQVLGWIVNHAVGSTMPCLNTSILASVPVPLIPRDEQKQVAEMLDASENGIAQSEAIIAKLRLMKAGLMHDLLTRGLADCGRGAALGARTADKADLSLGAEGVAEFDIPPLRDPVAHPDQFKETPLGLVPKCWDVCRLDGVGTWVSGGTPSKSNPAFWDGDIPWVTPKDMKVFVLENTTDYLTGTGASSGSRIAPAGSIFIVVRGMILAHTFPVCLSPRPMAFNQDVKAVLPDDGINSSFLAYWFMNAAKKMIGLTTEATHGTKRFDMADIYACQIALPHPDEQAVMVNILDAHDARLRAEEAYRDKLVLQKQGLMDDLLTGRVRLSR